MNSKSAALIERSRRCDAPTAACIAGHSSISAQQRRPGRRVQHHDDFERIPRAPRRSIADVPRQLTPQSLQPQLNVSVAASDIGQDVDQPLRGEQADVAMEDRPSDLKRCRSGR